MKIKTKIYTNLENSQFELLQGIAWYTLKELGMKTEIKIDTEIFFEIVGRGSAGSLLKRNKVAIFLDNQEIYVKFSSQMRKSQKFWDLFEESIKNITSQKETIFLLIDILKDIVFCDSYRQLLQRIINPDFKIPYILTCMKQ